ncbi:MAG: hypothetical protein WAQ53_14795 [Thiofilum sp.]|uniref:hypothetical protein n=1 Tax=Thiofilum sp. TaxID=2212733 RepID=UPI0025DAD1EE|nr:hypothetical protein [Thiofilum sp.]MBK8453520.1 hypothetical protein [Thiofilum sp.]
MLNNYLKTSSILLLAGLLSACATTPPTDTSTDAANLQTAYLKAVKDAARSDPARISSNLIAITPYNSAITWKKAAKTPDKVLMVTWTNYDGYDKDIGKTIPITREVWVTAVPELQNFCKGIANVDLRLKQALGLPPDGNKTKFVEFWVNPVDLFRPAPDPEITDTVAELEFRPPNRNYTLSPAYIKWFNSLKDSSYGDKGYPWTRLGYTYDWGKPNNPIGFSEFVINKGAKVEVKSVKTTADYCKP